jgi:hypothetical protein
MSKKTVMSKKLEYLDMLCDEATEGPWEFHAHDGSMASLSTVDKPLENVVFSTVRCTACQHRMFRCSWPRKIDANFMEAFSPKRAKALMKLAQAAIHLVNSGYDGPFMGEEIADFVRAVTEAEVELEAVEIKPTVDAFCQMCKGMGWYIKDEQRQTCWECQGGLVPGDDPEPLEFCGDCDGVGWVEGGEALQSTCSRCRGAGTLPRSW